MRIRIVYSEPNRVRSEYLAQLQYAVIYLRMLTRGATSSTRGSSSYENTSSLTSLASSIRTVTGPSSSSTARSANVDWSSVELMSHVSTVDDALEKRPTEYHTEYTTRITVSNSSHICAIPCTSYSPRALQKKLTKIGALQMTQTNFHTDVLSLSLSLSLSLTLRVYVYAHARAQNQRAVTLMHNTTKPEWHSLE